MGHAGFGLIPIGNGDIMCNGDFVAYNNSTPSQYCPK